MMSRKTIHNAAMAASRANACNQANVIPEEFQGWKIDCPTCNCKRQVVSSRTVGIVYDATEVYTLECGHTVI
jgi:hypothetical protein